MGEAPSASPRTSARPRRGRPAEAQPVTAHPAELDRVGVVLVSHSRAVAAATAALAIGLAGTGDPAPVSTAGGTEEGGLGTSAALVLAAARRVDQGVGVVVLSDLGSAVGTVRSLLAEADRNGLPFPTRFADAPFVEGAVAAVVTASAGGDLAAVVDAAEDAYRFRKG
ncbi:PTS fructose transporter subunit IIA [Peterkaempfera bronchialis]|uniref:PTS fructose transporter subunit IIA n=1 Tax=Peterkaempfera bronchialis TaxID=2126346 RepID=A0A345T570_9ACTN|nr:PTS fructose transporter subunit IIA [Peterkaempfera bronchialis]